MRKNWPRSRTCRRPLERGQWLGYWRKSWQPGRQHARDNPPRVDTMRRCKPPMISDGLCPSSMNCTRALRRPCLNLGFQPYLPPEGLCVLAERVELQPGALPMACVAVLCCVLWLRVGEVSPLRKGDVSLPLWMRFWNSKTGEEGWQSRPLSPWADGFREALQPWVEAKGLRASDHLFHGGSAWLEHKFLEGTGLTPWRHCRWYSLRKGGSAACYARQPQMQLFL